MKPGQVLLPEWSLPFAWFLTRIPDPRAVRRGHVHTLGHSGIRTGCGIRVVFEFAHPGRCDR
ncbi:hypothetical protein GCM10012319_70910 [Comamonas sp. KCTC 72670]|nr:hypothetical protein GCM10012319_70910 [Comamonas sp. KCTC 72670]